MARLHDLENRLLAGIGSVSGTLVYDPLGRLRSYASGGSTTEFLYDGDRLVLEYNASGGALLRRYVHGPGVDEPLIWYEGASAGSGHNWLIADRQGSIIATTNASGTATTYSYDPYGRPNAWAGSRFRYTGQIALPELQLYHYKARAYDPGIGRFLQTDPVGYEDDMNLYAYVQNDPLNSTDPQGKCQVVSRGGLTYNAGICGTSAETTAFVGQALQDPNSRASAIESQAVAQGTPIQLRTGQLDTEGQPVLGATTNTVELTSASGTVIEGQVVTIDTSERALVRGRDAATGRRVENYPESDQESFEHELGHVEDNLNGAQRNETNAIARENAYRQGEGNSFRREGHGARLGTRIERRLDR